MIAAIVAGVQQIAPIIPPLLGAAGGILGLRAIYRWEEKKGEVMQQVVNGVRNVAEDEFRRFASMLRASGREAFQTFLFLGTAAAGTIVATYQLYPTQKDWCILSPGDPMCTGLKLLVIGSYASTLIQTSYLSFVRLKVLIRRDARDYFTPTQETVQARGAFNEFARRLCRLNLKTIDGIEEAGRMLQGEIGNVHTKYGRKRIVLIINTLDKGGWCCGASKLDSAVAFNDTAKKASRVKAIVENARSLRCWQWNYM